MSPFILVILVIFQVYCLNAARILSVIPTASRSHHILFQPLWRELALRGHEVTVITTDPQKNFSLLNLKELDLSYCYQIYDANNVTSTMSNENNSFLDIAAVLGKSFNECHDYMFSLPEVQNLIHNKEIEFDLLIFEAQMPNMLAFAWRFKCPIIGVASLEPSLQFHDSLGNVVHPLINPDNNLDVDDIKNLEFMDRLKSFLYTVVFKLFIYNKAYPRQHAQMQKYFGKGLPMLKDLQDNISMMFVGTHPLFHNMRPSNLNTISVGGGMHITPPKNLPNDLQKFLDDGKNGVIYFSLGTNVHPNAITEHFKLAIMEAFAEVPYKVLLKMEGKLSGISKNVLMKKWMPQQDILRHKNVKLFITQGGLQSLQESIVNGVPLIGIPFLGDQISNVNRMVKNGYGLKIDKKTITKNALLLAIKEVIENPKYRETAKVMGEIFKDEEISSLKRAVYWTEYVIKYKGAKHLRSHVVGMPAWKYYMLDVLGFLTFIFVSSIMLFYLSIRICFKLIMYMLFDKSKQKLKKK